MKSLHDWVLVFNVTQMEERVCGFFAWRNIVFIVINCQQKRSVGLQADASAQSVMMKYPGWITATTIWQHALIQ